MNILFICNQNENRSKTAEELFKDNPMHTAKSAGLYNEKPVTTDLIEWANPIFVFERAQKDEIMRRFPGYAIKKASSTST